MSISPPSGPRQPEDAPGQHPQGQQYPAPRPQAPYAPPPFPQNPYGLRPPPRFNGLAIASLVLGLLWFVPVVGLVLGIVALGQIRRRGEQGRGMAIGGIVMSSVSLVAWVVLAALLAVFWDELDEVSVTGGTGVHALADGDCFDSPGGLVGWATEADRVPCEGEHAGEVFGTVRLPDGPYPGDDSLFDTADERCYGLEDAYAMDGWALPADVDVYHLTPSRDSWDYGDRVITCVFGNQDENGTLTGSLRRDGTTLDADQVVYLKSTHVINAALDRAPESEFVEDDLPGHREWAREISEALAGQSGMLRDHEWPAAAEEPVADLVGVLERAEAAWAKAAGADDVDTFYAHYDRGWELIDPERSVPAREVLDLATTPPVFDEDEDEGGGDGGTGGGRADEDRIEV
ncbi:MULTISPECIES: DUF4190 domain-containing protein [unclassified Streptomyces]|uniref:DUF4190 domain-containing protein n=1 Tax=unclassified Streptomyces TaxID=2593676 RepID=UPI00083D1C05|nr:DUF4190 domain-containing protein [Streptomyces sp. AVP053U2]ODA74610.1 hypothetical protein APS67_001272 [Streptomyces sp. AVP053U2]